MGPSILRLKGIAKLVHKCSGGPLRMMTTTTTTTTDRMSPWLMLPPEVDVDVDGGAAYYKFYSLASNKVARLKKEAPSPPLPSSDGEVRVVGSSHGWLATFNHDNDHIILSDPISTHHMKLPDIHSLPQPLCNCRRTVEKIVLTSSPTAAAESPRAVMTFGARGMAVCCPGGSKYWTWFGDLLYKDFVYSSRRKRLFCITRASYDEGHVESWDLSDPTSPTRDWLLHLNNDDEDTKSVGEADLMGAEFSRTDRYLIFAEQSDQLFMVTRHILEHADREGSYVKDIHFCQHRCFGPCYPYKTFAFDVHEIDPEGQQSPRYVPVEDGCLNGLAMFVGTNHSLALSAAEFPELKPDSIYFTEEEEMIPYYDYDINHGGHDVGIFNYVTRKFSSVYYSSHASFITRITPPPIWFTPTTKLH